MLQAHPSLQTQVHRGACPTRPQQRSGSWPSATTPKVRMLTMGNLCADADGMPAKVSSVSVAPLQQCVCVGKLTTCQHAGTLATHTGRASPHVNCRKLQGSPLPTCNACHRTKQAPVSLVCMCEKGCRWHPDLISTQWHAHVMGLPRTAVCTLNWGRTEGPGSNTA